MSGDWRQVLPHADDSRLFFLIDEVPTGEVEGPVNREPGLVVALPEGDPDVELSELGPAFITGQRVQALLFPQEA
jgi:hypothetical protein